MCVYCQGKQVYYFIFTSLLTVTNYLGNRRTIGPVAHPSPFIFSNRVSNSKANCTIWSNKSYYVSIHKMESLCLGQGKVWAFKQSVQVTGKKINNIRYCQISISSESFKSRAHLTLSRLSSWSSKFKEMT